MFYSVLMDCKHFNETYYVHKALRLRTLSVAGT